MLYLSLIVSLILFAMSHVAARKAPHDVRWVPFGVVSVLLLGGLILLQVLVTAGFIVLVLLVISLRLWPRMRARVGTFLPFSVGSVAVAYVCAFLVVWIDNRKFDDLRNRYPYESMEDRVPPPSPVSSLSDPATDRLTELENEIEREKNSTRTRMLHQLHEDTVRQFVNSPGFGVARMLQPAEWGLRPRERGEAAEQPGWPSSKPQDPTVLAATQDDVASLHESSILDFINAPGFGYVKDRRHVAGFLSHGFGYERAANPKWEAERIELIGLLLHSEPVVYLSNRRPVMEEVRDGPTRPLDPFETKALQSIRGGEDLILTDEGPRFVGAIRSARQCVDCHGGQRGDLLGAFSYTLRRVEPKQ